MFYHCCFSWLVFLLVVVSAEKPKLLDISNKVEEAVGQNTVISCNFESTAVNFTITWLKDGSPITFDSRVFSKLLGKTYGALFLNRLKLSDKGVYTCRGKNDAGYTDGKIEVDLIKVTPKIQPISKVYLKKDQGINLTCTSTAVPQATHKWMKKDGIFGTNAVEHKGGVLEIKKLSSSKEVYTCTATNVVGQSSIDVEVVEVKKLTWIEVPTDVNVTGGQSFTYTLSVASHLGEPKVLWYRNHMAIPKDKYDYTWMRVGSKYTSQLQFNDISVSDTGVYRAEVRFVNISPYQKNGRLTVWAKPDIKIEEGVEIFAPMGSSVTFTCIAHAYPQPSLRWEKNGTVILQANPLNSEIDEFRTTFAFTLSRVEEAGYYTCAGQNSQGTSEAMVKLNVYPPSGEGSSSNRTAIIAVVVVSVVLCIIIVAAVFVYVKYRDRICITEYTQASGKFYTDVVDEEREISNLDDYENNTNVIKKNINISIKRGDRSNSIAHGNQKPNASVKGRSLRQTIKGLSMKRPSNAFQESHYARLGTVVSQGKSIDFKHIVFDECLGSGEYGMVCGGRIIDDDNASVFKEAFVKMLKDDWKPEHRRDMLEELRMMRRISKHRNVISLIGWCITDDNVYVVEEYVPFGSLLTFLRAQRCLNQSSEALDQLPEEDRVDSGTLLSFAVQIASGMTHLAQLQVVHRDLACRNVYLGHEKTCKISDYGLVRDIYAENVYRKTTGGQLPVRWMARESVFEGIYSHESDVWSFGILLWELVNLGKIPYPGIVRTEQLLNDLESGYHMENPGHISTDLFLTMSSCWNRDPLRRPSFEKLEKDLRNYLNDVDETHIDLSKMLQSEVDEELACDDDMIQSPTTDFHRPNIFGGLKDVAEEDEEAADNENVNV